MTPKGNRFITSLMALLAIMVILASFALIIWRPSRLCTDRVALSV